MNEMELFINPAAAATSGNRNKNYNNSPTSLVSSRGERISRTPANADLLDRLEKLDDSHRKDIGHLA